MSSKVLVMSGNQALIWKKLKVRKSLDEICHYLELEVPASERSKIHKHDRLAVWYVNPLIKAAGKDRMRVTTVLVDELADYTDNASKSITVIGRSPARDIIDSTWSGRASGTLFNVVKQIAQKFNIPVSQFPDDGKDRTQNIASFSFESESPWTKLLSEASNQGYLLTSNEAGGLYIWKVASSDRSEGFHLTEGQNIRTIKFIENGAEQFHTYTVKGGGSSATVIDETCKNSRVLTINLTDSKINQETLRRRAQTEMNRRKENTVEATVTSWGLSDQQLKALNWDKKPEIFWNPDFLIPIKVPSSGINGKSLLISQVEYQADAAIMSCNLTLKNREAYL